MAVVFRRGPSKHTQQLVWNLETDEVTPGQWIKGRVYTKRCDVSPDGRYLVGAFTNYKRSKEKREEAKARGLESEYLLDGWTAVSRPPYFTSLALWFSGGAWNNGGLWVGPRELHVNDCPCSWYLAQVPPRTIKVKALQYGRCEDEPLYSDRLHLAGWRTLQTMEIETLNRKEVEAATDRFLSDELDFARNPTTEELEELMSTLALMTPRYRQIQRGLKRKEFGSGSMEFHEFFENGEFRETWKLLSRDRTTVREWTPDKWHSHWVDVDYRGRIIYGEDGCLWAWDGFPDGEPKLIADLNANKFEPIEAPDWAKEW